MPALHREAAWAEERLLREREEAPRAEKKGMGGWRPENRCEIWERSAETGGGWKEAAHFKTPKTTGFSDDFCEFGKSNGGFFGRGGFSNNRFVLKPDIAIASEVSILSKNSLAITDFHAKKTQHVHLFENPLPGTPFAIPKWRPPL